MYNFYHFAGGSYLKFPSVSCAVETGTGPLRSPSGTGTSKNIITPIVIIIVQWYYAMYMCVFHCSPPHPFSASVELGVWPNPLIWTTKYDFPICLQFNLGRTLCSYYMHACISCSESSFSWVIRNLILCFQFNFALIILFYNAFFGRTCVHVA